jgi:hypothetical protein
VQWGHHATPACTTSVRQQTGSPCLAVSSRRMQTRSQSDPRL